MPVYMISAVGTEMVKIGWADEVEGRRRDLQCAHYEELRVIRVIDGPRELEGWLHRHYADRRMRGEWYHACETMLSIEIDAVRPPPIPCSTRRPPTEAKRLINAVFGDYKQAIALLGVARSTLSLWESEGIPALRWKQMVEISRQLGRPVTLEMLAEVRPSEPATVPSEAA